MRLLAGMALLLVLLMPGAALAGGISLEYLPSDIAFGTDGQLWLSEPSAYAVYAETEEQSQKPGKIGRLGAGGQIEELSAGLSGSPDQMTLGPEGNIWFTEFNTRTLGYVSPDGVITELKPGLSGPAADIATGPDGNLWIVEDTSAFGYQQTEAKIARLSPSGSLTEFSAGLSPGVRLASIAAGPDGNMWFSEWTGNRIGRITPSGEITEFSSGLFPGGSPGTITAGSDGNLWFLGGGPDLSDNTIGRISMDGTINVWNTNFTGASIGLGPDGQLWAATNDERLGRLDAQGQISVATGRLLYQPYTLTAGPDGNLWFVAYDYNNGNHRLGRLAPGGAVAYFGLQAARPRLGQARKSGRVLNLVFSCPQNSAGCDSRPLRVLARTGSAQASRTASLPLIQAGGRYRLRVRLSAKMQRLVRAGGQLWLRGLGPDRLVRFQEK